MLSELQFEWDAKKAKTNIVEHRVSFEEAREVFYDELARITDDPDHSIDEERLLIFGHTTTGQLLLVSFADRAGALRLISARRATRRERKRYEEDIL